MVSTVEEVTIAGACAGDYVIIVRSLLLMTVVTHLKGHQTITIIDTTAPGASLIPVHTCRVFRRTPNDVEATATDNCGEVVITVEEVTTAGACAGDYVIPYVHCY